MMKKIFIPTIPADAHTHAISLVLERMGHRVIHWHGADFPTRQVSSWEFSNAGTKWHATGPGLDVNAETFDIVWRRRSEPPVLPEYHPDDVESAKQENNDFYKSFFYTIAPNAWWVNSHSAALYANRKPAQLYQAQQSHLTIPPTLISNDPIRIRDFLNAHRKTGTIYKPLTPMTWLDQEPSRATYTTPITPESLPNDEVLKKTPGIFQASIKKAYELRLTFFGHYCAAAKLLSQDHHLGANDWRIIPNQELKVEPFDIPETIRERCICMMDRLGIVFGCFDFIVTPENDYYFLEVNEMGQFLWVEQRNADIPMLDIFINFLLSERKDFLWKRHASLIHLADYDCLPEFHQRMQADLQMHVISQPVKQTPRQSKPLPKQSN